MMRGSKEWAQAERYRDALDRLAELQAGTDAPLGHDMLAQMAFEARCDWVADHGEPDSDESRLDLYAYIARQFYEQGMKIEPRDGAQCPITTNSGHGETAKTYQEYEEEWARTVWQAAHEEGAAAVIEKHAWILFKWEQDTGTDGPWADGYADALAAFLKTTNEAEADAFMAKFEKIVAMAHEASEGAANV